MIAMALSCEPKLIIADEPTTALDVTIQAQILELMKDLTRRLGVALIIITHNLGIVARYADRVNVMYAGRIIESGTARRYLSRSAAIPTRSRCCARCRAWTSRARRSSIRSRDSRPISRASTPAARSARAAALPCRAARDAAPPLDAVDAADISPRAGRRSAARRDHGRGRHERGRHAVTRGRSAASSARGRRSADVLVSIRNLKNVFPGDRGRADSAHGRRM